jgi:CRISPR-associated protein Cmr2
MNHLLAIAVGPVQEFIAAARRTRDLWFGSFLLSEISKAVAKSVKEQGGELIFPHPDTDLTSGDDRVNVANVILAELPAGDPKEVAAKAKLAAQKRWSDFADEAYEEASRVIRPEVWNEQVDDVIEFYAAWVLATSDYKTDCQKLMRLLAGRKNLRDFQPAPGTDQGLPKSSLDGQRPTVLQRRTRFPSQYRIREGEQLDVVGLVKRVAGGSRPYPSVSRVAADPWVRGNQGKSAFEELKTVCTELPNRVLHRLDSDRFSHFQAFPFEGTAIYLSRHHEWEEEIDEEDRLSISDIQDALELLSEPNPYLAVLVADGDKMGAAISSLPDAEANRTFSRSLAEFAGEARKIVNNHNGVLVYAGGDDVLAFLPVDKCLSCARALWEKFSECLKTQVPNDTPTLSVGIAIGHFMENLEDLLQYGRDAEKAAKHPDRNGLAVHLHKRGGAPIGVRARWSDNPDHRLERFANLMNEGIIPTKLPYELQAMARLYKPWEKEPSQLLIDAIKEGSGAGPLSTDRTAALREYISKAIQQDLYRLIAKKTSRGVGTVRQALSEFIKEINSDKLMTLASELLIARQIATALRQAAGRSIAAEEVTS